MPTLDELACRHGIALYLDGPDGRNAVPDRTKRQILMALGVDPDAEQALPHENPPAAVARCFLPDWLDANPAWGVAAQLYELRSARNWGIGDFADLAELCGILGAAGADFVGLNPLHALFLGEPARCSPFSPSNRLFLNPLYIAVDRVPGFRERPEYSAAIDQLRNIPLVDYEAAAALKLAALHEIWREDASAADDDDFAAFCVEGGEALGLHALFEALSLHFTATGCGAGWTTWPAEFRDSRSEAVAAFARENTDAVRFQLWLQYLAHRQLQTAARAARQAGMRIGLFLDLAVGDAPDGSATWSDPGLFAQGISIGAPPDMFSAIGQDWALAPLSPTALMARDLLPYREMFAANMRFAGALRMDHVMALRQLFWVPRDGTPAEGAHVRYPLEGMIGTLAETSHRYRSLLVGEDLGHVPPGFRETMAEAGILAYRPLYFEKRGDAFAPAEGYPPLALACLSTHDLPTLAGWWLGKDVALRKENGLITPETAAEQAAARQRERHALIEVCRSAGALSTDIAPDGALPEALVIAAHRFIAKTPSKLAAARLVDLVGGGEATNVPGTVDTYPNWRPKAPAAIEELRGSQLFGAITRAMAEERPRR